MLLDKEQKVLLIKMGSIETYPPGNVESCGDISGKRPINEEVEFFSFFILLFI